MIGLYILLSLTSEALLVKEGIIYFSLDFGFGHIFFGQRIVGRGDSVSFKVEALRGIICFHVLLVQQWSRFLNEKILEACLNLICDPQPRAVPYISMRGKKMFWGHSQKQINAAMCCAQTFF